MPRLPVPPSPAVAQLLRWRRRSLGLTLRDVERMSGETGRVIPFTTLSKIESGAVDPGLARLHDLLRLYHLPMQAAGDLLEIESRAGKAPKTRDPAKLSELAAAAWQVGRVDESLACLLAHRRLTAEDPALLRDHQDSVLCFAVYSSKLGKYHLARLMLDELLTEQPHPRLMVAILVQQAATWKALGGSESALAYLDRAEHHLRPEEHRWAGWVSHQRASIQLDGRDFGPAEANMRAAIRSFRRAKSPYDEAVCRTALARLFVEKGQPAQALHAARSAVRFASGRRFARVRLMALLEQGKAQLLAGSPRPATLALRIVLASAEGASDNVLRFHAHFYLWKCYLALGDTSRAISERTASAHYVQFSDAASREAIELGGS